MSLTEPRGTPRPPHWSLTSGFSEHRSTRGPTGGPWKPLGDWAADRDSPISPGMIPAEAGGPTPPGPTACSGSSAARTSPARPSDQAAGSHGRRGLSPGDTGLDAGLCQLLSLLPSPWKLASEMNVFQVSKCYHQMSARQAAPPEETLLLCDGENTVSWTNKPSVQWASFLLGLAGLTSAARAAGGCVSCPPYGFAIICPLTEFSKASCFVSARTSTLLLPAQKLPALPGTHSQTGTPRHQPARTGRGIIRRETRNGTTEEKPGPGSPWRTGTNAFTPPK